MNFHSQGMVVLHTLVARCSFNSFKIQGSENIFRCNWILKSNISPQTEHNAAASIEYQERILQRNREHQTFWIHKKIALLSWCLQICSNSVSLDYLLRLAPFRIPCFERPLKSSSKYIDAVIYGQMISQVLPHRCARIRACVSGTHGLQVNIG